MSDLYAGSSLKEPQLVINHDHQTNLTVYCSRWTNNTICKLCCWDKMKSAPNGSIDHETDFNYKFKTHDTATIWEVPPDGLAISLVGDWDKRTRVVIREIVWDSHLAATMTTTTFGLYNQIYIGRIYDQFYKTKNELGSSRKSQEARLAYPAAVLNISLELSWKEDINTLSKYIKN